MFEFMAHKSNAQYHQLKEKRTTPFWSGWANQGCKYCSLLHRIYGYCRRHGLRRLYGIIGWSRGIHLCGNPDWSFLLKDVVPDVLPMDSYSVGHVSLTIKTKWWTF